MPRAQAGNSQGWMGARSASVCSCISPAGWDFSGKFPWSLFGKILLFTELFIVGWHLGGCCLLHDFSTFPKSSGATWSLGVLSCDCSCEQPGNEEFQMCTWEHEGVLCFSSWYCWSSLVWWELSLPMRWTLRPLLAQSIPGFLIRSWGSKPTHKGLPVACSGTAPAALRDFISPPDPPLHRNFMKQTPLRVWNVRKYFYMNLHSQPLNAKAKQGL